MQQFNIDISVPGGPLVLYAMQADSMSRFFSIAVTDNGAAWTPPDGAAWTVRFGASGMPAGWYDTITEPGGGSHAAVVVDENTATVEIAEQAIGTPGQNILCVLVNDAQGYQLASWPFLLNVQVVPGLEAPEATTYYNALTEQVAQTLTNAQAAASSAAQAAASAASIEPSTLVKTINGVGPTSGNVDVTAIAAIQNLIAPIGYIFAWNAVSGGPDLSTAQKVAAYFGFGTWAAYGEGQTLVGLDTGTTQFATPGQTGGEIAHTLTVDEMPSHEHNISAKGSGIVFTKPGVAGGSGITVPSDWGDGMQADSTGGGQPHNNLQPYVVVYYWQRIA